MKIQEINGIIEDLKEQCGGALLTSSVISFTYGQSIAGFNANDKMDALLSKFTMFVKETMEDCSFGKMGEYYAMKLNGNRYAIVAVFDEYCWGGIIDTSQLPLGMIMNVILPDCVDKFKKALA